MSVGPTFQWFSVSGRSSDQTRRAAAVDIWPTAAVLFLLNPIVAGPEHHKNGQEHGEDNGDACEKPVAPLAEKRQPHESRKGCGRVSGSRDKCSGTLCQKAQWPQYERPNAVRYTEFKGYQAHELSFRAK